MLVGGFTVGVTLIAGRLLTHMADWEASPAPLGSLAAGR